MEVSGGTGLEGATVGSQPPIPPQPAPPQVSDTTTQRALSSVHQRLQNLEGRTAGTASSNFLGTQVLTATSGIYAPTPGTKTARVRMTGGGGGGGQVTGAAGSTVVGVAGGGASGVYLEQTFTNPTGITGGAYGCGAAGAGGATSGGGTGGDTVLNINGTKLTSKGGLGGTGTTAQVQALQAPGGLIQAGSSRGDFQVANVGTFGFWDGSSVATGGNGGSHPLGGGGAGASGILGPGNPGIGFGGGGGGAESQSTGFAGGAGAPGGIIIEEFS